MSQLADLLQVRSQAAIGVRAYLKRFVDLDLEGWRFPYLHPWAPRDLAEMYVAPGARDGERLLPPTSLFQGFVSGARIAILGGPGQGKTLFGQMACRAMAMASLQLLETRRQSLSELVLPIWVRADDIRAAGSVIEAVRQAGLQQAEPRSSVERRDAVSDAVSACLVRMLSRGCACLFVDSREWHHDVLDFVAPLRGPVVITARQAMHLGASLPGGGALRTIELEPLDTSQQRTFVGKWFRNTAGAGDRVWDVITGNRTLQEMAANALMLTQICAVATEVTAKTDLEDYVCERAISDMVRGASGANAQPRTSPDVERKMVSLHKACSALFNPGRTSFSFDDWHGVLSKAVGEPRAEQMTDELADEGLLVPAGHGGWQFLYPAFFEYLARKYRDPVWSRHYAFILNRTNLVHPATPPTAVAAFFDNGNAECHPHFKPELRRLSVVQGGKNGATISTLLEHAGAVLVSGPVGAGKTVAMLEASTHYQPDGFEIPCWLDASTTRDWKPQGDGINRFISLIVHSCLGSSRVDEWSAMVTRLLKGGGRLVSFLDDIELWTHRSLVVGLLDDLCRDLDFCGRHRLIVSTYGTPSHRSDLARQLRSGAGGARWLEAFVEVDGGAVGRCLPSGARHSDVERRLASLHLLFYWVLGCREPFPVLEDAVTHVLVEYCERYKERYHEGLPPTPVEQERAAVVGFEGPILASLAEAFGGGAFSDAQRLQVIGRFVSKLRLHLSRGVAIPGWPDSVPLTPEVIDKWLRRSPFLREVDEP